MSPSPNLRCWAQFCQWGGCAACLFFVTINILVLVLYGDDMDKITAVLRVFSIFFNLCIAMVSVDCLRNWAKGFLSFAWFLASWTTRGFIMVYLGVVAASSYAIDEEVICPKGVSPPTGGANATNARRTVTASDGASDVPGWIDVTRYVSGGLLCFFGFLYMLLSCCGADEGEDALPESARRKSNAAHRAAGEAAAPKMDNHTISMTTQQGYSTPPSPPQSTLEEQYYRR